MGTVDETFELSFREHKFRVGQGHFLARLPVVELDQDVALVDHLALAHQHPWRISRRQLRTELDLGVALSMRPDAKISVGSEA